LAIYRAQLSFQYDSLLPRDAITINPHYFGDNPQALGDALKTNLLAVTLVGAATPFTVKIYDAQKAPPSYPLYTVTSGTNFRASNKPREVALCLSYYSTYNRPHYRGRMYLPATMITGALDLRPSTAQITEALAWKTTLGSGLPANHNWVVYSRVLNQSNGVNKCWVDDEWDTVRSRGLKATTRQLANVP
jgi:hypothetical protein